MRDAKKHTGGWAVSEESRKLQIGDWVLCDWKLNGQKTAHKIVSRLDNANSQSRICFRVSPPVHGSSDSWIDADWFERVKE